MMQRQNLRGLAGADEQPLNLPHKTLSLQVELAKALIAKDENEKAIPLLQHTLDLAPPISMPSISWLSPSRPRTGAAGDTIVSGRRRRRSA